MKILLTGSKGNLGQTLIRLGSRHQFITLDRGEWDRLDRDLQSADIVIHAASDLLTPIAKDPGRVVDSNVMATTRLLEAMARHPKTRLMFVSSCAVYGQSQVTDEDVPPAPISINGIAKLLNEKMISEFCSEKKIEFQILRLFNTFGGKDRFSILSHLQRSIENKKPFTMYNDGVSQRDFVHVEDVAALMLKIIEMPIKHQLMNLGSGEATRIADIVTQVRTKFPKLEITHRKKTEAEYSRAETARLRDVFPDFQFRSVLDFIREEF